MEDILNFVGIALLLVGVFFVIFLLMNLLAKASNTKIVSRTGSTVASPENFDFIINSTKSRLNQALTRLKKLNNKSVTIIESKTSTKLEKLSELHRLRQEGAISQDEYEYLKSEILN